MAYQFNAAVYKKNVELREQRKQLNREADTPLKDIRLYFTYDVPAAFQYLFGFTEIIGRILQQKQFLCPGYSHIYISIGENTEEAIARAYEIEDWYRFGVAVLKKETLLQCPDEEREKLVLQIIADGLRDIAILDKLDQQKINEAIRIASGWGLFHERILKEKENKKFLFRISAKPLKGKSEEEIYFTLIDRDNHQNYTWKFGELHTLMTTWWFFKINVTNKLIRTKPRANMQLALKGRKNELELIIEKIINGTGRITLDDTIVPVEQWIIDLEEKIKKGKPNND